MTKTIDLDQLRDAGVPADAPDRLTAAVDRLDEPEPDFPEPRRASLAAMSVGRDSRNVPRPSSRSGAVSVHLETPGGSRLRDGGELATELARRLGRLDHGPGVTRTVVASVVADYPADRKITADEMVSSGWSPRPSSRRPSWPLAASVARFRPGTASRGSAPSPYRSATAWSRSMPTAAGCASGRRSRWRTWPRGSGCGLPRPTRPRAWRPSRR